MLRSWPEHLGWILLDSALHAPQAGFGDVEFYPDLADKAAVLVVRIAKNHPLPDGNERLAWQSLTMFCVLNGYGLEVPADDAVSLMLDIAAGAETEQQTVALRALSFPAWHGQRGPYFLIFLS